MLGGVITGLSLFAKVKPQMGHDGAGSREAHEHEHEEERMPINTYAPHERVPRPQLGTKKYVEEHPSLPDKPMPKPSYARILSGVLSLNVWELLERPTLSQNTEPWQFSQRLMMRLWGPSKPLKPVDYTDAYWRPNPCPEETWEMPWRWTRFKMVNPKIPPPIDGKYNDFYHYLAFKHWFQNERRVYCHAAQVANLTLQRCMVKEGPQYMLKNCRHLRNKVFAMTRSEELHQVLLYMSITGNCAIRETPYPDDFVEQKRKIYDDWLFRTRMKRPRDVV